MGKGIPLSSQSLAPLPECTELADEDTDERRARPTGANSFFTGFCFGLTEPPSEGFAAAAAAAAAAALPCLRALFPARSSSKRSGLGRKCVRSYRPHLLHTILPGLSVERRHEGGSVVWQLKQRRRRYCVSLLAASSVCCTGRPACGDMYIWCAWAWCEERCAGCERCAWDGERCACMCGEADAVVR